MTSSRRLSVLTFALVVLILVLDQGLKFFIKTHFALGEDFMIFRWFHLHFVENNGMAFGLEMISKTFLSVFRIVAVLLIAYGLVVLVRRRYPTGFVLSVAAIFAGAVGNIIDCVFYGRLFSLSTPDVVARLFPAEGYAPWLHGKVVDMLYFPLIDGVFPAWLPVWGGEPFEFFAPVFNLADAAITVGVFWILLFQRPTLQKL